MGLLIIILEWINKSWSIHTTEYYMAMKMNSLQLHATIRMTLTDAMIKNARHKRVNTILGLFFFNLQKQLKLFYAVKRLDSGSPGEGDGACKRTHYCYNA